MSRWIEVKKELLGMSAAFNRPINELALKWFIETLEGEEPDKVLQAMRLWARQSKRQELPTPTQILELINPERTREGLAREAAAKIIEAVGKFGWPNGVQAMEFIGPLGWRVVDMQGGWVHICENLGVKINESTAQAQWRDLALALIEKERFESNSLQEGQAKVALDVGVLNKLGITKKGLD